MNEAARDVARVIARTQQFAKKQRDRKKVEILFSHLKRILRLVGSGRAVNAALRFEFTLAAIAQNNIGQGNART